ncbi:hypothetical protein [uncultured Roseobacter sp.]|uniref:hypothetical protein n=1 Tax=uncultured Roseobacter sp. TaxID=114847 RepID=UPI002625BB92|nr:hypothetical protein [uncultured Roseobacter sp.]
MAYDPLSRSTRTARTLLISVSVFGYLVADFDLALREVPGPGINLDTSQIDLRVFCAALIGYYLISFYLYVRDDQMNPEPSPRQLRAMEANRFALDYLKDLSEGTEFKRTIFGGKMSEQTPMTKEEIRDEYELEIARFYQSIRDDKITVGRGRMFFDRRLPMLGALYVLWRLAQTGGWF